MKAPRPLVSAPALAFVLTMGIVNLFGDVTYEDAAQQNLAVA